MAAGFHPLWNDGVFAFDNTRGGCFGVAGFDVEGPVLQHDLFL